MEVRIRQAESVGAQPALLWDSVWDAANGYSDWAIAPITTARNPAGLIATENLHTAIIICLFTWVRADAGDTLPDSQSTEAYGWWGDGVDLDTNEVPMGSKLWMLYRSPLNAKVAAKAVDYAKAALKTLLAQGAVARFDITSDFDIPSGRLALLIKAYSQAGTLVYNQKFDRIWRNELR